MAQFDVDKYFASQIDGTLDAKMKALSNATDEKVASLSQDVATAAASLPVPHNTLGKIIGDSALSAVQGTLEMGKAAYGVANILSGGHLEPASRAITSGASHVITAGMNALTGQNIAPTTTAQAPTIGQGFGELSNEISGAQSDFHQAAEAQRQQAIEGAHGIIGETGAYIKSTLANPSLLATDLVGSYPQVLQPAMAARSAIARFGAGAAEKAMAAALEAGATKEAAIAAGQAATQRIGEMASSAGIGAQVAASNNIDVADHTMETPQAVMNANPRYQAMIAAGMSDQAARDELGRKAGLLSAAISGPASLLASGLSGYGKQIGDVATGAYAGKGVEGVAGAIGHHVAYEYPMQFGEKVSQNLADSMYGDTSQTDLTKGAYGQAASGSLAGGLMGVGEHMVGHALHTQPAVMSDAQGKPVDPETFQTAVANNDPTPYLDPKSPNYAPSTAIGVLLGHAQQDSTAPEVKQANLKQAGDILANLEDQHAKAQDKAEAHSPEAIQHYQTQLDETKAKLAAANPADTNTIAGLNAVHDALTDHITQLSDKDKTRAAVINAAQLERQVNTARSLIDNLHTVANPRASDEQVNSLVDQVNSKQDEAATPEAESNTASSAPTEDAASSLINLSMKSPDVINSDTATQLASNTDNSLNAPQRDYMQAFADARKAEGAVSTDKVSQQVLNGGPGTQGIAQYRSRMAAAIATDNKSSADLALKQLTSFANAHQSKADAATQAMSQGMGTQIAKTPDGSGWQVVAKGGTPMKSPRLVANIKAEAGALSAAVKEMSAAHAMKFGTTAQPDVQSGSAPANTSASGSPASLFREKREREGRVEEDKSSSPQKTPESSPEETKPLSKYDAAQLRNANQKAVSDAANAAYNARQVAKTAAVEQPASASEAPAVETATSEAAQVNKDDTAATPASPETVASAVATATSPAASSLAAVHEEEAKPATTLAALDGEHDTKAQYQEQNLVATKFKQTPGNEGDSLRPLASVRDFLSALKNKSTKVSDFLQQKAGFTEQQQAAVKTFVKMASDWAGTIKANLIKTDPKYAFNDLIQNLINEHGDLDENTKTAIAYAAFSWVSETVTRPELNSPEEINMILGRGEDALVSLKEKAALENMGTRQNVVIASLGQRIVASLGLKALASAPRNLQADLEMSVGTHAMKLLMDEGILDRSMVSGKDMAALTGSKNTNDNASFYFLKLARTNDGALSPAAQRIYDANAHTKGIVDKLFGVEAGLKDPSFEPIKTVQKTTANTDQAIPSSLEKIIAKDNAEPSYVRTDMFNLANQLDPQVMLEIAGHEVVDDSVHVSRRASIEAKNDGLARELERYMGFVGSMTDLEQALHFEHSVWKQQRVGIATNTINPQTSKIHRAMLYRPSWETKLDFNDGDAMSNFRLRVAEGLGVKTDKMSQEAALAKFASLASDPVIQAAVEVLGKTIDFKNSDATLDANEQQALLAGVKMGGENMHSLDALMALAQHDKASKAGDTSFTTHMMAEVDGVTNGPMFSHLLMGAAGTPQEMFNLLNKGGFYQVGNAHTEYNNWRDAPGNFDLYETTAINMTKAVTEANFDTATMSALYAFTGELADSNGLATKAGRNIIKTPLTAMVFGSSVASAVDSMADKFVESIYSAIEDSANGVKDALSNAELRAHLATLGVSVPAKTVLMEHEFNASQIAALKAEFTGTLGKAVESTMEKDFAPFIAQRRAFNQTAQLTFLIYNAAYTGMREQMIKDLIASGEMAANPTTGKPIHDLTSTQEKQLREKLADLAPVMNTAMSQESKQIDAGLLIAKSDRKLSTNPVYNNVVKFAQPFADNGAKSTEVHGYEKSYTSPGVAMMPMSIHSFDSAVSHTANPDAHALNIHDAQGQGVGNIKETARSLNEATWNQSLAYSPATEIKSALLRTVTGLDALLKSGDVPASVMSNLASTLVDYAQSLDRKSPPPAEGVLHLQAENAQQMAYTADAMKLDTMSQLASINQYAMEGGAFKVENSHRAAAAKARAALDASIPAAARTSLNSVADQLKAAIKAEQGKRDGKVTAAADPEMDPVTKPAGNVAELGKPSIPSTPALVAAFEKTPVMGLKQAVALLRTEAKGEFNQRLLTLLERATGADISIQYVTKNTLPNELLDQGGSKARGWYVSKDGKHTVYVLSPEFKYSGLTAETLLHELTHAALARTIEQAQDLGKGDAFELVQELEALRKEATSFATKNALLDQFAPALENVHELVSWGMSNADFQSQVLGKVQMASKTGSNKLVTGMKSFIDKLTALLFGRANENMSNGLSVLINNTAGLFNKAAQGKNTAQPVNVTLNQTAGTTNARDFSTADIYNAIEDTTNGRVLAQNFDQHLRGLLAGIVAKLHGPFGSFKAAVMANRSISAEAVYEEAKATGIAPFASQTLAAGFLVSEQEAFALEQVEATVRAAMDSKETTTTSAYNELAKLYTEVAAKIKPENLFEGDWAKATVAEKDEAEKLHAFIFNAETGPDGYSDYLSRFAALGLAHEGFNKLLQNTATDDVSKPKDTSFAGRLNALFNTILNWFSQKISGASHGQQADARLNALVKTLVDIEAKRRRTVEVKQSILAPAEEVAYKAQKIYKSKLEAFGKMPFFQKSGSEILKSVGNIASIYGGGRADAVIEGFQRVRDQHFAGQQGLLTSMLTEFRGANETNLPFHFLLRATKQIEGNRQDLSAFTNKGVVESFDKAGAKLTPKQHAAISAVMLRTDMASLLDTHFTMAEITGLIDSDKTFLKEQIAEYEDRLAKLGSTAKFARYFKTASKGLAYKMAVGKVVTANQTFNAGNIARLLGTAQVHSISEVQAQAAEKIIDPLVSLYALDYSKSEHMKAAREVMAAENARTDGGHGVEMLLKTHRALQEKSRDLLFDGSEALQYKGYTPEIYNRYMDLKIANEEHGRELIAQGYAKGAAVGQDKADVDRDQRHMYTLRDGGMQGRVSGIFSTKAMRAKGTQVHNGNVDVYSSLGQINAAAMAKIEAGKQADIAAMFTQKDFDPTQVKEDHLAPILNASGDVVNYRYMMEESTKDNLLGRENRPGKLLGSLAGSIYDKTSSPEQNRKAVQALHDQFKLDYAEKPESYMKVGPSSFDPQLREIYRMLPYDTQKAIKEIWGSDSMMVRKDLLDMNFGYRKLSLADAFGKEENERNLFEKMIVEMGNYAFDKKAPLRVRQAEEMWQEVVKATKANYVVKSWSTLKNNFISNVSELALFGVINPVQMAKAHKVAFQGAWTYRQDSAEIFSLKNQLEIGYKDADKAAIKSRIAVLEDALKRNPVAPLIEAGLMPTIVDNMSDVEDEHSFKSRFVRSTEKFTDKLNPHVLGVAKTLLMTEDTKVAQAMSYATQISDFLARYTLYEHLMNKAEPSTHAEAIQAASDAFVNYDIPTHRKLQYANDVGLVMFTKYYLRLQKTLGMLYKQHPGRVMAMIGLQKLIGHQATVLDSGMTHKIGNPLTKGAFNYPGSLNSLLTVRVLMSPFGGAGNSWAK